MPLRSVASSRSCANQAGQINHNDVGAASISRTPDGHFLEVITRPYGSGV